MTRDQLTTLTRKELVEIAKEKQVGGVSAMRKQELIDAIASLNKRRSRSRSTRKTTSPKQSSSKTRSRTASGSNGKLNPRKSSQTASSAKSTSRKPTKAPKALLGTNGQAISKDILEITVQDSRWVHCSWQVRRQTLERAQISLGVDWHSAKPVLRLFDVTNDDNQTVSRSHAEDISVDGQASHWYAYVRTPGRDYRMHLGFLTASGRFLAIARSARFHVPANGTADDSKTKSRRKSSKTQPSRSFATVDELTNIPRLKAPIITSVSQQADNANGARNDWGGFEFAINAEATIYGRVAPGASLSILDETIPLAQDGSFAVRVSLPEGRQVLPTVAISPDGDEVRTIVLALERNTKELEPQVQDEPDF